MAEPRMQQMLRVIEETTLPAPRQETIKDFEADYRVHLSIKFVEFVERGNGAKVKPNTFDFDGNSNVLERFLCMLERPQENETEGWYDIGVVITQLDERLVDDEELIGINEFLSPYLLRATTCASTTGTQTIHLSASGITKSQTS